MHPNKTNHTSGEKSGKTIGTPKCSNKVRVTCPSAPKIAQYFKALGGTLNTKANPTAGMAAKAYHRVNSVKHLITPPRNNI